MAKTIATDEIRDGDRLLNDVLDPAGNVILGEGTVLSRRFTAMLKKRGITAVVIDDSDTAKTDGAHVALAPQAEEPPRAAPAENLNITKKLEAIEHMFSDFADDAHMQLLYEQAKKCIESGRSTF